MTDSLSCPWSHPSICPCKQLSWMFNPVEINQLPTLRRTVSEESSARPRVLPTAAATPVTPVWPPLLLHPCGLCSCSPFRTPFPGILGSSCMSHSTSHSFPRCWCERSDSTPGIQDSCPLPSRQMESFRLPQIALNFSPLLSCAGF